MTCKHIRTDPYVITPEPPKGLKGKPPQQRGRICQDCKLFLADQ